MNCLLKKVVYFLIFLILGAFILFGGNQINAAEREYPTKPITLIVPWTPGSLATLFSHLVAEYAQKYLGQMMVILTKPGGGGSLGTALVASATPDGYTIGECSVGQWGVSEMISDIPYSHKDLKVIASLTSFPAMLFVRYDSPWNTLKDFLDAAKKAERPLRYGSVARAGHFNLLHVQLNKQAGVKMTEVPFDASDKTLTAVLSGETHSSITGWVQLKPFVEAKKIKVLAVVSNKKSEYLHDVPTTKELGYENSIGDTRFMFIAPQKTPAAIIEKLDAALKKVYDDPEFKEKAEKMGITLYYEGHEELSKRLMEEREHLKKLIQEIGLHKK